MTITEHAELYDEIKTVIYTRGIIHDKLTDAQKHFIIALESAAFGSEMLKVYADLVDKEPNISLRNLHAFCIGFGLGLGDKVKELNTTKTSQ